MPKRPRRFTAARNVAFPPDHLAAMDVLAARQSLTTADLLRQLVRAHLETTAPELLNQKQRGA